MRIRMAFLSCTVVAIAALLAPTAALATGSWSCSTFNPTVAIVAGPCPVSSGSPTACEASGAYTGIKYMITGNPDHAATVVTANNTPQVPSGFQAYLAGDGDPVTGLGKYAKHEKALKVNPNQAAAGEFWVVVGGTVSAIPSSVVVKKGSCVKSFAIDGLGYEEPVAPLTETVTDGECSVEFTMNGLTGTVIRARLTPASILAGCQSPTLGADGVIEPAPSTAFELFYNGVSLGAAGIKFGNGVVNTGNTSCTTKIVGGRVYTYGKPCPE